MIIWLTIVGMALVTYAARVATLLALRGEIAPWLRRWLGFVPVAVLLAMAAFSLPRATSFRTSTSLSVSRTELVTGSSTAFGGPENSARSFDASDGEMRL